jgi:hypothetical protein
MSMDNANQKHPPPSPPASPCAIKSIHGDGSSDDPMLCLDVVAAASRAETNTNDDMENQHIPQGQFWTDVRKKHKYSES